MVLPAVSAVTTVLRIIAQEEASKVYVAGSHLRRAWPPSVILCTVAAPLKSTDTTTLPDASAAFKILAGPLTDTIASDGLLASTVNECCVVLVFPADLA